MVIGDYETASEVVREGPRLLKQRDDRFAGEIAGRLVGDGQQCQLDEEVSVL